MSRAAKQLIGLGLILLALFCAGAADGATRGAPSRPASIPSPRKIAGIEYLSVPDIASQLSLKLTWIQRGRKLALTGPSVRADLENDTREITVNGMRVFLGDPIYDYAQQLYVSRVDFERCLTPLLRPGHATAGRPALKTIVLDPGHGGRDHGTSAKEKVYALDVARRAKKLLEAAGHKVVLTRDSDVYLDLTQRAAIANANRAGLFASIHFNAISRDRRTSGVEVFTFAPQYQRSTNSWSPGAGNDTEREAAPVNRHDHWSVVLAHTIHRRFVRDLKTFDRGKKIAHWGVLRQLRCPGVLIECGFLTSDAEARKIATASYRQKIAQAIASGIADYAASGPESRTQGAAASSKSKRARKPVR
jgi:N-acetylmuramoyl-L-alanine amidase